jgi:hypothetical protein
MFVIPTDLTLFSAQGLETLRATAREEYTTLFASVSADTVTDEQLDRLEALKAFDAAAKTQLATFAAAAVVADDKADRLAALSTDGETEAGDEPEAPVPAPVPAPAVVEEPGTTLSISQISANTVVSGEVVDAEEERPNYGALIAASDVPNFATGQEMTLRDVAEAFLVKTRGYGGLGPKAGQVVHGIASIARDYPAEFSVNGTDGDEGVFNAVIQESRLPGGSLLKAAELRRKEIEANSPNRDSLVAAAGWCAPSETLYEVCFQGTTDGLVDVPEVQARRGGIRYNQGITFATIYGDGAANFFNLTEAEVASGTEKTCIEITCPTFTDVRLGVTGICLTGNILTARAYPEAVETFTRAALVALAHKINFEVIADMVAGSDAVNLTAAAPWVDDASVVSQVLSAVDMAVMDIKYRMRLQQSATLEVVMPFWILTQMRADWIRRNGVNDLTLANSAIMSAFAARGARVQFVYDWQDAFSGVATGPGAAAEPTAFPTSLVFLVYPAGTWVKAVQNVITINSLYDSTKLATNQYTHLFTEDGWAMAKMCGISRVYTVGICPSGSTGAQREVGCAA